MADFTQPLPTAQPDLSTLFQYMPAIAAGQVGTQQRVADQNNSALQQAFQNQENYNQQSRPLQLNQTAATTREIGARGNLYNSQARNQNLAGDFTAATQPGAISAANAKNKTAMSDEEIKQLENMGDLYRQAAAASATETTPWGRVAAAKKVLGDHVQQGPELDQFLMQYGDALPQHLADLGGNIYGASREARASAAKYAAEQKKIETQGESAKNVATIGATSREQVAETNKLAKLQAVYEKAAMDSKNRGAALAQQANAETDPQKKADLYRQADVANQIHAHDLEIAAQARNETGIVTSKMIGEEPPPRAPLPSANPGPTPVANPNPQPPGQPTRNEIPTGGVATMKPGTGMNGNPIPIAHMTRLMEKGPKDAKERENFNAVYGAGSAEALLG